MKNIVGHNRYVLDEVFRQMAEFTRTHNIKKDFYGGGEFLNNFEKEVADLAGMESAFFLPSGVMAQLIAMKVHSQTTTIDRFGCHATSHLLLHENDAEAKW